MFKREVDQLVAGGGRFKFDGLANQATPAFAKAAAIYDWTEVPKE